MNGSHLLWSVAAVLASLVTVAIAYESLLAAAVFWLMSTILLLALRPD